MIELRAIVQAAKSDRDLLEYIEWVYAHTATTVPETSGLPAGFYERSNLCVTCRRVYPKEITFCRPCGRKVRTRGRNRR